MELVTCNNCHKTSIPNEIRKCDYCQSFNVVLIDQVDYATEDLTEAGNSTEAARGFY